MYTLLSLGYLLLLHYMHIIRVYAKKSVLRGIQPNTESYLPIFQKKTASVIRRYDYSFPHFTHLTHFTYFAYFTYFTYFTLFTHFTHVLHFTHFTHAPHFTHFTRFRILKGLLQNLQQPFVKAQLLSCQNRIIIHPRPWEAEDLFHDQPNHLPGMLRQAQR